MRTISAPPLSRVLAILAFLAALLIVQSTSATPARATELGGVFTDVQVIPGTATDTDHMSVQATFAIPSGAVAGDTFTLALADPFAWVGASFDVLDPGTGAVVAHVVVSGTTATFTLTDYVEQHANVVGTVDFMTYFKAGTVTEGDVVTATFTTKDDTFTDDVTVVGPNTNNPPTRKEFRWTDRTLQDGFTFAIFATTLGAVPDADRTVTITDIPSVGVQVTCSSLTIQMAPDAGGVPGTFAPVPVANRTVTCPDASSPRGFVIALRNIPANYHVRVRGTATVTDTTLTEYTNVAQISIYGETPVEVTNTVRRFSGSGEATGTATTTTTTTSSTTTSSTTTSSTTTSSTTTSSSTTSSTTTSSSTTTPSTSTTTDPTLPATGAAKDPALQSALAGLLLATGVVLLLLSKQRTPRGRYTSR